MEAYLDSVIAQFMAILVIDVEVLEDDCAPSAGVGAWVTIGGRPPRRLFVAMPYAGAVRVAARFTGLDLVDIEPTRAWCKT